MDLTTPHGYIVLIKKTSHPPKNSTSISLNCIPPIKQLGDIMTQIFLIVGTKINVFLNIIFTSKHN
jgi:hypothetical protein